MVRVYHGAGADVVIRHGTGTIRDTSHEISFGASSPGQENHATEGNQPARFQVVLDRPATETVTVDYETVAGRDAPATSGSDYTRKTGTLTFTAGQMEQTVAVAVLDDDLVENRETVGLRLSSPSAGARITSAPRHRRHRERRPLRALHRLAERGRGPVGKHRSHLHRRPEQGRPLPGAFQVRPGSERAESGDLDDDFTGAREDGSLSFAPGETEKRITYHVNGDEDPEPHETVVVRITRTGNQPFATGEKWIYGTGTIRNDDSPVIAFGRINFPTEGGDVPLRFPVVLNPSASAPVTVYYRTDDANTIGNSYPATSGEDYQPASGTLTFAPGETREDGRGHRCRRRPRRAPRGAGRAPCCRT